MAKAGFIIEEMVEETDTEVADLATEKIIQTGYSGSTAIEAMNWYYMDLSIEEFLHKAFESAKKLEVSRNYNE